MTVPPPGPPGNPAACADVLPATGTGRRGGGQPPRRFPVPARRRSPGRRRIGLLALAAVGVVAGLPLVTAGADQPTTPVVPGPARVAPAGGPPVTLAFAGDVNVEGSARAVLRGGLGAVAPVLAAADLTVVNLETAVTEGGERADKQFAFKAPARTFSALRQAGIDVVSMANNHGMDYGETGLRSSLAAAADAGLPVVGLGVDERSAYAPHVATVRGTRIAVLGATQVLDAAYETAWTALGDRPGMASAKREERLLEEVRAARASADVVVVYLHWGKELQPCPLERQQVLARQLVDAGADVVVGTHAHVLLGGGHLGGGYVDYGLGNFAFASHRVETARTGVLTLTLQGRSVTQSRWTPAVVRGGVPVPLEGAAADQAARVKQALSGCAGLAPPGLAPPGSAPPGSAPQP